MPAFTGVEEGPVTEVEEHDNAFIVYFKVEEDFDLGFTLFKEDLYYGGGDRFWRPSEGEKIELNMGLNGLLHLKISGKEVLNRTEEEAAIWKEIRKREVEISQLKEQLGA